MAYHNIKIESSLVFNDEQMDVLNKAFKIAQNHGWQDSKERFIESLLFVGSIPHIMRNVKYMYPEALQEGGENGRA